MSRSLRHMPRASYYEPEEPRFDEYEYCEECADFVFEYCAIHGPLLVIPDDKPSSKRDVPAIVPRAALTIPSVFLHLAPSIIPGAGIGVFSTLTIPRGVRFGPYRGERANHANSAYCWQIYDGDNRRSHVVDAADVHSSNWMRYVNCARRWTEQNLVAYQYRGELYYRTVKIIPRFTELLVFYGGEFGNALRLSLKHYNAPRQYVSKSGAHVAKKLKLIAEKTIAEKVPSKLETEECEQAEDKLINTETTNDVTITRKPITENITQDNCDTGNDEKNVFSSNNVFLSCDNVDTHKRHSVTCTSQYGIANACHRDKPYTCDICHKQFTTKRWLATHIRVHTGDSPYKCNICGKCLSRKSHLDTHIRIHTGEKPYECDSCNKCFSDKSTLAKHIRIHTGAKPYKCDICNKCFGRKDILNAHIRTHTGEKPYKCDFCYKCFSQKSDLVKHIRIHTGEKPYRCDFCYKSFNQKCGLEKHIRIHTGERPYKCDICNKCFSQKSDLVKHIRIHTGEKPYRCDFCYKSFNQKSDLEKHIRIHIGERPYKCDFCNKCFSSKSDLVNHIRIHTGEKPYKCDIRNKYFSSKSNLAKHILSHR